MSTSATALQSLDPWTDAQTIATRLQAQDAELLVALGAEAWCDKCKTLRPAFEALCLERAPSALTWLWLDLEEHAEFIGDFVPEDLPLLLHWRGGKLQQVAVLEAIEPNPPQGSTPDRLRVLPTPDDLPDMWAALSTPNWAG